MLAIKLQRIGKKHQPSYRVVVAEKRSKMAGPPVEDLGSYNVFTKALALRGERVSHWLKVGARPTPTVHNLLVQVQLLAGPKMKIKMKPGGEKTAGTEPASSVSGAVLPAAEDAIEAVAEAATEATAEDETSAAAETGTDAKSQPDQKPESE